MLVNMADLCSTLQTKVDINSPRSSLLKISWRTFARINFTAKHESCPELWPSVDQEVFGPSKILLVFGFNLAVQ